MDSRAALIPPLAVAARSRSWAEAFICSGSWYWFNAASPRSISYAGTMAPPNAVALPARPRPRVSAAAAIVGAMLIAPWPMAPAAKSPASPIELTSRSEETRGAYMRVSRTVCRARSRESANSLSPATSLRSASEANSPAVRPAAPVRSPLENWFSGLTAY